MSGVLESTPRYCSPEYLLEALVSDGAPMRQSMKLAQGYAAALEDLDREDLHVWLQSLSETCLSRGWQEAALALLTAESEHQKPIYLRRAEKYLRHVGQK